MASLDDLNAADDQSAITLIRPLIERAPDLAKKVAARRPFSGLAALKQTIAEELRALSEAEKLTLFRAHPELAPDNPLTMTAESQAEQGRLHLTARDNAYRTQLSELNSRYREKFGFPFITALVRHLHIRSVMEEFETRMNHDLAVEIDQAVAQIAMVSAARVDLHFAGSGEG